MKITSASPEKQSRYENKLKIIDQHINNSIKKNSESDDIKLIFSLFALNLAPDPPQQVQPFIPKIILLENTKPRRFLFQALPEEPGKKYALNVNAQTSVRIGISVDSSRPKMYHFQGSKAIIIHEQPWKELIVIIEVDKIGPFSSIKILLEHMKTEHKSRNQRIGSHRPNIDAELDQYLKATRGKTAEILRQRSLARMKTSLSRRKISTMHTKREIATAKDPVLVKSKSQLLKFQKKKDFYIRHVEKMSPEKTKSIKFSEARFIDKKHKQMANLAKIVIMMKFGFYLRDEGARIRQHKLKQMRISMLCYDFVKILKNKFKLKMTERARLRMVNLHYFHRMPALLYEGSVKKSRQTLLQSLKVYMQFRSLQQICQNSEDYLNGIKKIQLFFRNKRLNFLQRINIFTDRLCYLHHIDLHEKVRQQISEQYFKYSQSLSKIRFRIDRKKLLEMIREREE